jgi:23S rRNA (guanine2445-N2)-methyltransferase / 23S rRNA (guanine2069-N7)-methyltransferase
MLDNPKKTFMIDTNKANASQEYFAACPKSLENLLLQELTALGADDVRETVAGVYFTGETRLLYKACLWSRLANKILLPLANFSVKDEQSLYDGIANIAWEDHLEVDGTFKVDFIGTTDEIRNTQYGAVRVKDAIVDRFQKHFKARPSIDKKNPDVVINARLSKGKVNVSLDLSGQSLHRRGYRQKQGEAPLKENLASAILLRANWPTIATGGGFLVDPMCGSGTLLIEGFMIAADIAPGLMRAPHQWGFTRWNQFDEALWTELVSDAKARKEVGLERCRQTQFECRGYDLDWRVINAAQNNIERAGLDQWIRVSCRPIDEFVKPTHKVMDTGLLICNPPYGERLGDAKELEPVYFQLGHILREHFIGWQAAVITSNPELSKQIAIRALKRYKFWNGTLAADLVCFNIDPDLFYKEVTNLSSDDLLLKATPSKLTIDDLSDGAKMLCNRLLKNKKQLNKWLKKESIDCYRVYDADIPEYSAAIDVYGDYAHIQEYAAPKTVDEEKAKVRFQEIVDGVTVGLALASDHIFVKQRRRNKGKQQYEKTRQSADENRASLVMQEGPAALLVDLWSYLDTGLFLDHRPVRKLIGQMSKGKSFLNLFCYTASASVHAALGGATKSVSVDMSRTYIDWAKRNFEVNDIDPLQHQLVPQDCLTWLQGCRQGFDVILLDPPSFSNSKKMEAILDIQRDHVTLIKRSMELLNPNGTLIFSNNLRSFTLDDSALAGYTIENITDKTLDPDYSRNRKIHHCWLIRQH